MMLYTLQKDKDKLELFKEMCESSLYSREEIGKVMECSGKSVANWCKSLSILFVDKPRGEWNKYNITDKPKDGILTKEILHKVLDYNKKTGEWIWLETRGGQCLKGQKAGSKHTTDDGYTYLEIQLFAKSYRSGQLAYLYVKGYLPFRDKGWVIDHQNHNTLDDSWDNIKAGPIKDNNKNHLLSKNNKSGHTGVYETDSGKWSVIMYNKRIGLYNTYEEACKIADKEYINMGYHENHGKTLEQVQEDI